MNGEFEPLADLGFTAKMDDKLDEIANVLMFAGHARADFRISFFYRLLRDCGIFAQAPAALPSTTLPSATWTTFARL